MRELGGESNFGTFLSPLWYRADFSVEINELLKTKRIAIFIETIQYTEYIQFTLQVTYT